MLTGLAVRRIRVTAADADAASAATRIALDAAPAGWFTRRPLLP